MNGLNPAAALSATVGLKAVRGHGTAKLIEVDKEEASWVFQLSAHHVMDDERLPDHLHFLHTLHRLGNQQNVSEQETVHIHLSEAEGNGNQLEAFRQVLAVSLKINFLLKCTQKCWLCCNEHKKEIVPCSLYPPSSSKLLLEAADESLQAGHP